MAPNDPLPETVTSGGKEEDAALAVRAAKGDPAAFGVLYDRHVSAVYRYVYYRVRDDAEAEDLTSDVFMKALRAIPRYEPRQAVLAGSDKATLRTALGQLTPLQQEVIVLRFLEGYSTDEIARLIGKREGTVRGIQFRALGALRQLIPSREAL